MYEIVPEGRSGKFRIQHSRPLTKAETEAQEAGWGPNPRSRHGPDRICNLVRIRKGKKPVAVMTDYLPEQLTNMEFLQHARGDVLVAGLGFGMIIVPLLYMKHVKSVTVVEKHRDVIKLSERYIKRLDKQDKLRIVNSDIHRFHTDQRFDTIYFDIWDGIHWDNVEDMNALIRRFRGNARRGAWIGCWGMEISKKFLAESTRKGGKPRFEQEVSLNLGGKRTKARLTITASKHTEPFA
jgi:hypothetical protein